VIPVPAFCSVVNSALAGSSGVLRASIAQRILPALLLTLAFALLAYRLRAVDATGAIAGAGVSFLLYLSSGPAGFLALGTVFLVAWVTTRLGYSRKQRLGTAEQKRGRRAVQVLSNLAVATGLSMAAGLTHREALTACMVAALAEAAGDTASSEVGQAFNERVYLITTFRVVRAGTDGGVSVVGSVTGIAAGFLVTGFCGAVGLIQYHWVATATVAAVLGTIVDSLLGATFQRRGWLTNDSVNFLSTLAAAGFAFLLLS
jgi:uncharacterized protein (TIGR00297 family)